MDELPIVSPGTPERAVSLQIGSRVSELIGCAELIWPEEGVSFACRLAGRTMGRRLGRPGVISDDVCMHECVGLAGACRIL